MAWLHCKCFSVHVHIHCVRCITQGHFRENKCFSPFIKQHNIYIKCVIGNGSIAIYCSVAATFVMVAKVEFETHKKIFPRGPRDIHKIPQLCARLLTP